MRRGELIASLLATALASLAKLASSHSNLPALDRCTRASRMLAVVAISLVSFAHEAEAQQPVSRLAIIEGIPSPLQEQGTAPSCRATLSRSASAP